MTSDQSTFDDEWENRQLCSDGNCIGVIGPDGLCKECGKPGAAGEVFAEEEQPSGEAAADQEEPPSIVHEEESSEAPVTARDDDEWENRRLCPDGNCIGVIGPDGKCKECGRPAE